MSASKKDLLKELKTNDSYWGNGPDGNSCNRRKSRRDQSRDIGRTNNSNGGCKTKIDM